MLGYTLVLSPAVVVTIRETLLPFYGESKGRQGWFVAGIGIFAGWKSWKGMEDKALAPNYVQCKKGKGKTKVIETTGRGKSYQPDKQTVHSKT